MTESNDPSDKTRDEILRRMLNTPPKPHKPAGKKKTKKRKKKGSASRP